MSIASRSNTLLGLLSCSLEWNTRTSSKQAWMDQHEIDLVAFPAAGDVGRADVYTNDASARHALQNAVKYSNGNRAMRHMGVPTVAVTMGLLEQSSMPVNLTFAGKHGQDVDLLRYAYAFEQQTKRRIAPSVTPALESDGVALKTMPHSVLADEELSLEIASAKRVGETEVEVTGSVSSGAMVEVFVDGKILLESDVTVSGGQWSAKSTFIPFEPPKALYGGVGKVVSHVVIVVLARDGGRATGKLIFVNQK
ncbi:hypothetical protein AC579_2677 [Pseudocercospora musae]|uniref:Amidase domain-containing protein n=1 Tax=Pseudocercospora musae TaxID=113226 RepID=A0A139IW31_9PEZI|nr:hypothetical protein AC579_2677 [Pseudocercospora musae]